MRNNILKIINEKYEKYSIGYSKIKCPKSEHMGRGIHFSGAAPYFFGQNRSSPPPKMARMPMGSVETCFGCGGIVKFDFVANLPVSLPVKKVLKIG